jgi:membrane-associated phospholipid phosphatase
VALASTALAVLAGLVLDELLARWVAGYEQSSAWNLIVGVLECLAGIAPWDLEVPIVLVTGTLLALTVARWHPRARSWMYVTVVYLLARNLMMWGKLLSGRYRPYQWMKIGGPTFGHIGQGASFPSGHITLFGGLILPLVIAVPRLRPLLLVIPFVMVARIAVMAHFLSDVLAGLALISFVAWACAPLLGPDHDDPAARR